MSLLTASQLERVMACPASRWLPQVASTSAAAERGTAIHAYLSRVRVDGVEAALAKVPAEYRPLCEALDLWRLPVDLSPEVSLAWDPAAGVGRVLGQHLERDYSGARPGEIVGSADVIGVDHGAARVYVGDYKTGYGHVTAAARNPQLRLLALAAVSALGCESASVEVIRIRPDGTPHRESADLDALDLAAVAAEMRALVALPRPEGVPSVREGEHCRYCPAFSSCPAKVALAIGLAEGREFSVESMLPLTPERAGVAWDRLRAARAILSHIERACIATLDENGGCLPLPGGRQLQRVSKPGNEMLDGAIAFEALAELHGVAVAAKAVTMDAAKSRIRDALRPVATKHGELGRLEREALDAIRARGGVGRQPTRSAIEEVEP